MHRLVQVISISATIVATLLTLLSLAPLLAEVWWVAELFDHFRPHYAVVLLACTPILIAHDRWIGSLVLLPILYNLAPVVPLYQPIQPFPAEQVWSVLHYNLDLTAADHTAAMTYLQQHPVDILLLQEVTPELEQQIVTALPTYQLIFSYPLSNTQGSALLLPRDSPIQVQTAEVIYLPETSSRPTLVATLMLAGQEVTLLSMQATRPRSASTSAFQHSEFEALAAWSQAQQHDPRRGLLLIGDINTTPWSARFRRLRRAGQLQNSATGYGIQSTWPTWLPAFLGIPIDHCLVNTRISVVGHQVGPDIGGDHRPLLVQFIPGLTRSPQYNVFCACGSVEETLFPPQIFAYGENLGWKRNKVPLCRRRKGKLTIPLRKSCIL